MQHSTTHTHYSDLLEENEEYWKSPQGIQRRIEMIGEHFTYKIVNNAIKLYGEMDGAKRVVWYTQADERVCAICGPKHMRSWKVTWFTPRMPAHVRCRCYWMVEYD